MTPLMAAVMKGHVDVVKTLLKVGDRSMIRVHVPRSTPHTVSYYPPPPAAAAAAAAAAAFFFTPRRFKSLSLTAIEYPVHNV